jgi:hypothetical protein
MAWIAAWIHIEWRNFKIRKRDIRRPLLLNELQQDHPQVFCG